MASQQWYYRKGTARFGPVSGSDIKKMAAEGKLEPTDLLRGVGMTEWIPASKIKGLFTKKTAGSAQPTSKPSANDELGLVPLEKPKPAVTPVPKPKPSVSVAQTKPMAKPTVKPPKPVAAVPQAFSQPEAPNPFAQFGLEPTLPNDPFAAAMTAPNDPFATAPNLMSPGVMAPSMFDNLAALEKQSQAIYREPAVEAEPDPFAKKAKTSAAASSASGFGAGSIAFIAAPFLFVLFICFPIGVAAAWVPALFVYVDYLIAAGTSKMVGLIAGNCMLKVKIKNEVLALGYGGLIGLFLTYIFMAASFWTYINFVAFITNAAVHQIQSPAPREMDEDGRSLVLRPDERPQFPMDQPPPLQSATEENDDEEDEESSASDTKEEEWVPDSNDVEVKRMQIRMELMERLFGKGISLLESISPFILSRYVWIEVDYNPIRYLLYWLIMLCTFVAITAHSTWMANLGSDPTSSSGF